MARPYRTRLHLTGQLNIHLFGHFRVLVDGTAVDERLWQRKKAKLLLKILALTPQHQLHREQLFDLLWPDLDALAAANNLDKTIHAARKALQPRLRPGVASAFISRTADLVSLHAPRGLWIDVEAFEHKASEALKSSNRLIYEEAIALYAGDLLLEDLYEEWPSHRRERLRMLYQDLLSKLAHYYEVAGRAEDSIECLNKLLALDPSNEDAHRRLMKAYALMGRRQQALRQYEDCRQALRQELDTEPEKATSRLYEQILAGHLEPLSPEPTPSANGIDSLAILPFINTTANPELEYLTEGITESLITNLSQLPHLRLMARSSVFRYQGREADPQVVGRELGVRAVLVGRVLQWSEKLTIGTELVDVHDGSLLWREQYNRKSKDIFAVQEEISKEISRNLRLKLTGRERKKLEKRHTENTEAYHLYLKGRYYWNKRTGRTLQAAIRYFQQAIESDPAYALAHTGLADCYNLLSLYSVVPPKETMPKAKAAALVALEIDETLAEAHTSLAYAKLYYDWDWAGAEEEFKHALDLNPNYPTAHHWYHEYLTAMGRFQEQEASILRAVELDPLSLIINTDVGWGYYHSRRFDSALQQLHKTLELDPNFAVAHLVLGQVYLQKGTLRKAVEEIEKAIELAGDSPFPLALGVLGYACALSKKQKRALEILQELENLSRQSYVPAFTFALVYNGLNDPKAALNYLHRAYAERYDRLIYLNVEPMFDNLRSARKFRELVGAIGLEISSASLR